MLTIKGDVPLSGPNHSHFLASTLKEGDVLKGTIYHVLTRIGSNLYLMKMTSKYALCLTSRRLFHYSNQMDAWVSNKATGEKDEQFFEVIRYSVQNAELKFIK